MPLPVQYKEAKRRIQSVNSFLMLDRKTYTKFYVKCHVRCLKCGKTNYANPDFICRGSASGCKCFRKSIKGIKRSPESILKGVLKRTGQKRSLESRKKMSIAQKLNWSDPDLREQASRIRLEPEVENKRKTTMLERYGRTGNLLPSQIEYWINLGYSEIKAIYMVSNAQSNASNSRDVKLVPSQVEFWLRGGYSKKQSVEKVRAIQSRNSAKNGYNSGECDLFLDSLQYHTRYSILREILIDDAIRVDGFIPSLGIVIEYYGTYWHKHPKLYSPYDICAHRNITAKAIWDKDRKRISKLRYKGYSVLVIWSNSNKLKSINKVLRAIARRRISNGANR